MSVLILMRHAKAVRENEAASDRARGLTSRGRREAAEAGEAMLAAGLSLQVVCASAAVRTVETAVIVGGLVAPDLEARFADRLYLAAPGAIWDEAVRLRKEDGAVLIVGHNPGLHELVAELIGRSGERSALARTLLIDLPTAAWIAFEVQDDDLKSTSVRILGGWTPSRSD